jgi:hypothetical protein
LNVADKIWPQQIATEVEQAWLTFDPFMERLN